MMAIDTDLKIKARTYYETHFEDVKEIAKKFDIPARTLYRWIKEEDWQQGSAKINNEEVGKELLSSTVASQMDYVKEKTKNGIRNHFLDKGLPFDEDVIDSSTDEILFEAMSIKFIDKTLIETALYSKQALKNFHNSTTHQNSPKLELLKIQAAKDVCNIFDQVKKSIHGKDAPNVSVQIANIGQNTSLQDLANMSNEELNKILLAQG